MPSGASRRRWIAALTAVVALSLCGASAGQADPAMTAASIKRIDALRAFTARPKFIAAGSYTGVRDPAQRQRFHGRMNQLAGELESLAAARDPKPALLRSFERAWPTFELADTEDREAALGYFEELMAVFGVDSSDGLLNRLAYGFDPSLSPEARQQAALAAMTQEERALVTQFERLTQANAVAELRRLLGKPQIEQGAAMAWLRGGDPGNLISLGRANDTWMLTWVIRGQLWGRALPPT